MMPSKTENLNFKPDENGRREYLKRFSRQTAFADLGIQGQLKIAQSGALVVGMGGLGSWAAEFLVRSGIGRIRIADGDCVELSNLHRQAIYTEKDAADKKMKTDAAAERLREINSQCIIEPFPERINRITIYRAAQKVDIIIDGTDNFETRFLINDYSIKFSIPWVSAGIVGGWGQVISILPGKTPCLRCIVPTIPSCSEETADQCSRQGVLGAAVPFIAAMQAVEAIKILSGSYNSANPYLMIFDLWHNHFQTVKLSDIKFNKPCQCCDQKEFIYLEP
jgi:adenylyltransferase/sulfurtransferase